MYEAQLAQMSLSHQEALLVNANSTTNSWDSKMSIECTLQCLLGAFHLLSFQYYELRNDTLLVYSFSHSI